MDKPAVMLLYSEKDKEWKNYLTDQFENNAARDILVIHEPLEHFTWQLEPNKQNLTEIRLVLMLLSTAFLDFLKKHVDHLLEIKALLKPRKTVGVLFGIQRENLKHFCDYDFSWDDWPIIQQEDMEKVIHTVEELLEQSEKKGKSKSHFKLVPRKVHEGRGRVYIILDEPLEENQQPKVFSGETEQTEINIKKINPYNWQFLVPDSYMRSSNILKVGIYCNGDMFGFQTLKCESRLRQLYNLLSASCGPAELMCDALGVNSYAALDCMLARAFKKRFPSPEICKLYIDEGAAGCTQAKEEIPTLVHFAARYGLKHLLQEILDCPGSYSACTMKNAEGLTPAELASHFKHHDLYYILKDFQSLKCSMTPWNHSPNNLSASPVSPNLLSSVSIDAVEKHDSSNYASPLFESVEYDYIDEHLSYCANDQLTALSDSGSPNSETFLESQSKLLEINEAYKKGASEHEVLSMFNKWQSTYHVDSEAKSKLEDLRNLYAKKNRSNRKNSASFSDFKQFLFKILSRRKETTDLQDAIKISRCGKVKLRSLRSSLTNLWNVDGAFLRPELTTLNSNSPKEDADNGFGSQEVCDKFMKNKDSKSHYRRLSKTFSTASYASASTSSSSDHLSVASEHSDYHEFTSFKNNPGLCAKNRFSNVTSSVNCKKSSPPVLVPPSPLKYPPQNYPLASTKKESSNCNGSGQNYINNHQNEYEKLPVLESIGTFQSNSQEIEGYDVLPFRPPLLVQQVSVPNNILGPNNSARHKNTQGCVSSCSTEYDTPRFPVPTFVNEPTDLTSLYKEIPCVPPRAVNGSMNHKDTGNSSFNGFRNTNNFETQPVYGNIWLKEVIARRNSIPEEIAPAPPLVEEEEYYKYIGTPVPIEMHNE